MTPELSVLKQNKKRAALFSDPVVQEFRSGFARPSPEAAATSRLSGKALLPSWLTWWLVGLRSSRGVSWKPLSSACHLGLAKGELITWQLTSSDRARERAHET